ncbi:response regulator transcription factor [Solimonas sp. K1W22B-7]|uniref:response regulator transcription factor n=1 Tax=Solimonas sp. K1W22B-7 TaxID=2303331 RepID=UPI0013C4E346
MTGIRYRPSPDLIERLTKRELEVLDYLSQGRNSSEIAAGTGVTVHTVKHHLRNIYAKLGVGTRLQAVIRYRDLLGRM